MPIGKGQRALIVSPPSRQTTIPPQGYRQRDLGTARNATSWCARRRAAESHRYAALGQRRVIAGSAATVRTHVGRRAASRTRQRRVNRQDVVVLLDSIAAGPRATTRRWCRRSTALPAQSTSWGPRAKHRRRGGSLTIIALRWSNQVTGDTVIFEVEHQQRRVSWTQDRPSGSFPAVDVNRWNPSRTRHACRRQFALCAQAAPRAIGHVPTRPSTC